jgi:hypothetical protein
MFGILLWSVLAMQQVGTLLHILANIETERFVGKQAARGLSIRSPLELQAHLHVPCSEYSHITPSAS